MRRNNDDGRWCSPRHESVTTKREEPSSSAKSCCCGLVSIIVVVCILCVALLAGLVALAGLYVNLYVDTRSCSQSDVGTTRASPDISKQPLPVVVPSKPVSLSVPPDSFQYLSVSLNETSSVSFSIDNTGNDLVIAVYGRIGAEPTHVIYDVVATLVLEQSRKRSVDFRNKTVIFEDLSVGNWIFGVFNGDSETLQSDAVIDLAETNLKPTTEETTTPSGNESNEAISRAGTEEKPTDSFVTTAQTSIHESSLGTTQVDRMHSTVAEVTKCTTTVIETSTVESTTTASTLRSATTSNVVRSTASSTTKVADTSMAPQTACVCPSLPPLETTSQEFGSSDTPAATTDITTTDSAAVASTPPTVTTGTTHVNTSSDDTTENQTWNTVTESASPDESTQVIANQTTEFITKEYNVTTEAQTTDIPIYAVSPNQSVPLSVPPDRFQYLQLQLNETSDVTFVIENYELDVRVVIYGRMKFKPTHFDYDDSRLIVERSSLVSDITVHFEKLSSGTWSFGILNGNNVTFKASITAFIKASAKPCPLDCLGRGGCKDGICDCVEGWTGGDCSKVDPISCEEDDCGGHGTLREGVCHCSEGWTGDNCLQVDCIPSDCNGHGSCVEETCICDQGWKGIMCDEVDCIPSDCNTNGQCVDGVCHCDTDWQGDDCSIVHRPCLNDCSGHGDCDNMTGICSCHDDWQKQDCSEVKCGDHDCSGLGVCHNGTCDCDTGWTGRHAQNVRDCEYGCREHGSCQSGTCICNKGWTGTACDLDACPNNCTSNGDCILAENLWQCVCQGDFKGADCAIAYESTCDDGIDNDQDTFIDCEDPDCCNDTVCESVASCSYSDSPEEYAQTNESATQHFYDQVSFLFEESGIQQEVEEGYIQPSLISVLRGYVTNRDGTPLQGVTIAIQGFSQYGYTTTRKDGGFDMAVNGGGVLTATFSKMNFIGAQRSVQPTINQYFVLSKIVILLGIDPKVTKIDLDSDKIQIAEGSESEDAAGKRKGVIMFHPGTEATVVSYNGTDNQTLTKPSVRITEYTVGENGEEAMPAQLPPFTGYTYAMELSMDEAAVNGSTDVFFNQKLYYYVEDYLGFPVGSAVPTGIFFINGSLYFIRISSFMISSFYQSSVTNDHRVSYFIRVQLYQVFTIDLVVSFNDQELEALADLYTPGQKLWRVPIPHFTPWDCNWPYGPPTNSCVPAECNDLPEPFDDCNEGSTTPINQNAPTQNPDPPEESPAPTNGYNPNLPVQSPEIIKEVTPKYPEFRAYHMCRVFRQFRAYRQIRGFLCCLRFLYPAERSNRRDTGLL
ncbi:teneurin-3-like [Ptychodera flava]|uniref:teneurin-3-like n=1 Tax=Ptychodera flava TaxID=63121 RepID=UPI00396A4CDB